MSLLGRLEDLSLPDIIQIVYLSRRTGMLEILTPNGRNTIIFHHGLIVHASTPEDPDLITELARTGRLNAGAVEAIRQSEEAGVPAGTSLLELNLFRPADLADLVYARIESIVRPLLENREGEFNFILSDSINPVDITYDPGTLFRDRGISPQKLLAVDGEKLKPLRGLEESLRAGKALLRGGPASTQEPAASLDLGLGGSQENTAAAEPLGAIDAGGAAEERDEVITDALLPFPAATEEAFPQRAEEESGMVFGAPEQDSAPFPEAADAGAGAAPQQPAKPPQPGATFKVVDVGAETSRERLAIVYERDPLVRVAAKRVFSRSDIAILQYGSMSEVRREVGDLLANNRLFITFLDVDDTQRTMQIVQHIKRRNIRLPVVVIDREADLKRRQALLEAGADLYMTKPSEDHLQPGLAEEQLAVFADELVDFAQRSFEELEQLTAGFPEREEAGKRLYEFARHEQMGRGLALLGHFINELSSPADVTQVTQTILRLAGEYLDRAALFLVHERGFVGTGGFGQTGGGSEMNDRVRRIKLPREEDSVLRETTERSTPIVGRIRRTRANEFLVRSLGSLQPSAVGLFPIVHHDRVVGILYGDNAVTRAPLEAAPGLELFLAQSGLAVESALIASSRRIEADR